MTSLTSENGTPATPPAPVPEKRGWASAAWAEIKGMFWLLIAVLAFHSFIAKPFYYSVDLDDADLARRRPSCL